MFLVSVIFIIMGILIAVYPQLLSAIVSFFLIFIGIFLLLIRSYFKRASRGQRNPFMNFFIKY